MIVSFHPIIEADTNIICAGRQPDDGDLAVIKQAKAVILPQGCSEALYRMARINCTNVFPNLDVRFDYPGKRGQVQLFERLGVNHPQTYTYASVEDFNRSPPQIALPAVVKFDWGGQGDTVFKVNDTQELSAVLRQAKDFESSGQQGFLVQQLIASGNRSLRVVVIGTRFISYWRIPPQDSPFGAGVARGAVIDHVADPDLQSAARSSARRFCEQTGLQLAGFDFLFDAGAGDNRGKLAEPFFLEINYFFGRTGLGGSEKYYDLLTEQVDQWLSTLLLKR